MNTNYMRSVNDYSLSSHEIYNHLTGRKFPNDTRVHIIKNVERKDFNSIVEELVESFKSEYEFIDRFDIIYDDDSDLEGSAYTIYEQRFYAFRALDNKGNAAILEVYQRGSALICLVLASKSTDKIVENTINTLRKKHPPKKKDKVFYTVSVTSNDGFELEEMKIPTEYDENLIKLHYNDDFVPVHELVNSYIDNDRRGLFLLHGVPGSGKTSYIKQLISKGGLRKIVYIPPHLASHIASPQFISFVRSQLKSAVLVIEDAEDVLHQRGSGQDSSAVQNLLNISDGILGDALNILIIATFNNDTAFIDQALKRKGRMVGEYKFGPLKRDKAIALAHSLYGNDFELNLPDDKLTLAEIFNLDFEQPRVEEKKTAFGFAKGK